MLDHSQNEHAPGGAEGAESQHVWHFCQPGEWAKDRWDPTPLTLACQTLSVNRKGSITRIHAVFLCPEIPGGAIEVVEYAQSLAADYGLSVHCAVSHGMVTVTFERGESNA